MKNLMHLEDLAFFEPHTKISEIVSALAFSIIHPTRPIGDLTVKFDGAPLVVFGNEDGFFVSHKGYFNKEPIRFRSVEDINLSKMHENKKAKLIAVFNAYKFSRIQNNVVYLSDFLFANDVAEKIQSHDEFQPNIIRYEPKFSDLSWYKLGLAYHTKLFCGQPYERGQLPHSERTFVADVKVDVRSQPGSRFATEIFSDLGRLRVDLDTRYVASEEKVKQLRKYMNTLARECSCYAPRILDYYEEQGFKTLRNNIDNLVSIKYTILNYLNRAEHYHNKQFDMYINNLETTHEGYVFRYEDYIIKLVDRFQFSKANFDQGTERGWQAHTIS